MKKLLLLTLGILLFTSCKETREEKIRNVCETAIKTNLNPEGYQFEEINIDTCSYDFYYSYEKGRDIIELINQYKTYFHDFEQGEKFDWLKNDMEYKIAVEQLKILKQELDNIKEDIKDNIEKYKDKKVLKIYFTYSHTFLSIRTEEAILLFLDKDNLNVIGHCDLNTAMKLQGYNEEINKYLYIMINYFGYNAE